TVAEVQGECSEGEGGEDLPGRLGQDAQALVLPLEHLEAVVDHPDRGEGGGQPQDQQAGRGEAASAHRELTGQTRGQVAQPDRGEDREAAHVGRAALAHVGLRPLEPDLLAVTVAAEVDDQHRRAEDAHDKGHDAGDHDLGHRALSSSRDASSCSATLHSPTAAEAFTRTMSPGSTRSSRIAAASSAVSTCTASEPHEPSCTAPWNSARWGRPRPTTTSCETSSRTRQRPRRTSALTAPSPSSPISPRTAPVPRGRPRPRAIMASDLRAARIESGLALYESLMTVAPSVVARTSIRRADAALAAPRAVATAPMSIPQASPTAAAARALPTWCSPWTRSATSARPCGAIIRNRALAWSSRLTPSARMSAGPPTPTEAMCALVRSAIARTRSSSWLSTATPPSAADGSASTSSPLVA